MRPGDSDGQLGEGRVIAASSQRQGLGFPPCGCLRFTPHLWPSQQNPVSTVCNCLTLPREQYCCLSVHWERKPSWALGTLKAERQKETRFESYPRFSSRHKSHLLSSRCLRKGFQNARRKVSWKRRPNSSEAVCVCVCA